jgi:hypothetical protein
LFIDYKRPPAAAADNTHRKAGRTTALRQPDAVSKRLTAGEPPRSQRLHRLSLSAIGSESLPPLPPVLEAAVRFDQARKSTERRVVVAVVVIVAVNPTVEQPRKRVAFSKRRPLLR